MLATVIEADRPSTTNASVLPRGRAAGFADFCHGLIRRGRIVPGSQSVRRQDLARISGSARPLLDLCRDLIGKATPRFVVAEGGYRNERVILGGRRTKFALWDPEILGALGPWRYSSACVDLLVVLYNDIVALRRSAEAEEDAARTPRTVPREPGEMPAPETWADVVFFHLVLSRVADAGIRSLVPPRPGDPPEARANFIAQVVGIWIEVSPLTVVCRPHLVSDAKAAEPNGALESFLDAGGGVLATYLSRMIAREWVAVESAKLQMNVLSLSDALEKQRARVGPFFDLLSAPGREHLLRCFAEFYHLLIERLGPAETLVRRIGSLSERMASMSETESLLDAAAAPFAWGDRLNALADEARDEAFVERTESRRLFLQDVQEIYEPVHEAVALIHRRLSRTIG